MVIFTQTEYLFIQTSRLKKNLHKSQDSYAWLFTIHLIYYLFILYTFYEFPVAACLW